MEALRKTHQRSKKNPYAARGLDKFALLSAELEEKRQKLVAQLGSSLSIVRFEVGSDHHNWIPVISCPTLSSTEIRILKGMATRLIAEDKPANSYEHVSTSTVSHKESDTHASTITSSDVRILAARNVTSALADEALAHMSDTHVEDAHACHQTGASLSRLLAASERFLWMAGFIFSIAVDVVRSVLFLKWHAGDAAGSPSRSVRSYSSWRLKEVGDHPSASKQSSFSSPSIHTPATMSFSTQSPNLPRICAPASIPADGITAIDASQLPAHVEAHKVRSNKGKGQGLLSAPSTPRYSRQGQKSLQASVSFPKTMCLQDDIPRSSPAISKDFKYLKSVSLPNTRTPSHKLQTMLRSPASMTRETAESKKGQMERSQNLGRALTVAGLALGLGGLVMGFIPAIVCIVCWWYGLPSMRRAVGDKPHVKSHHLSK